MSDLIAIAYQHQDAVERAREGLRKGVSDGVIDVEDVVVMIRDEDGPSTFVREALEWPAPLSVAPCSGG